MDAYGFCELQFGEGEFCRHVRTWIEHALAPGIAAMKLFYASAELSGPSIDLEELKCRGHRLGNLRLDMNQNNYVRFGNRVIHREQSLSVDGNLGYQAVIL